MPKGVKLFSRCVTVCANAHILVVASGASRLDIQALRLTVHMQRDASLSLRRTAWTMTACLGLAASLNGEVLFAQSPDPTEDYSRRARGTAASPQAEILPAQQISGLPTVPTDYRFQPSGLTDDAVAPGEATPDDLAPKTPQAAVDALLLGVQEPLLRLPGKFRADLNFLIHTGLANAPSLSVVRIQAAIASEEVVRQSAAFDWTSFLDTNWIASSAPVDSALSGADNRLDRDDWINRAGLRQLNRFGGSIEASQGLSTAASNSEFFNPVNQGSAVLQLEYRQPLMRNAGRFVGTSLIELAVLDQETARYGVVQLAQNFILEVADTYWSLVAIRGEIIATSSALQKSKQVIEAIEARAGIDTSSLQLARARAAMKLRESARVGLDYQLLETQERLLRLVYGQHYEHNAQVELLPTSLPAELRGPRVPETLTAQAYSQRPEIKSAIKQVRRASIQLGVAKNQLLPLLELSLGASNRGVRGNYDVGNSFLDQFNQGPPTYNAGLTFERPIGNRRARAEQRQAALNLQLLQKQFEETSSQVALEVRTALLELSQAEQQVLLSTQSYWLATQELSILEARLKLLLDGDQVGALYLDNLLQTQDRQASAQAESVAAHAQYTRAIFNLDRAVGSLFRKVEHHEAPAAASAE